MPRSFSLALAALVLPILLCPEGSSAAPDLPGKRQLQAVVDDLHEAGGTTALLVGLWEGDREVATVAAGTSMTGIPAEPAMHFRIGALSITTLTTLLLQLVDEGVVSLDDPLARWLPQYPQAGRVTLRMLANCSSGYADYVTEEAFVAAFEADVFRDWSAEELVRIALDRGMQFEPGTGFQYSHANFILLAEALVAATGQPLKELVEARIIAPLGLGETSFRATPALASPVLHAFTMERGLFEDSTFWNPSWTSYTGFLTADLHDLGRLTRALARGTLITPASHEALLAPTNVGRSGNSATRYYGLGVAVMRPWIMQSFSFGGYGGTVGHLPERDVTLVVVTTLGRQSDPDVNPSTAAFQAIRAVLENRP